MFANLCDSLVLEASHQGESQTVACDCSPWYLEVKLIPVGGVICACCWPGLGLKWWPVSRAIPGLCSCPCHPGGNRCGFDSWCTYRLWSCASACAPAYFTISIPDLLQGLLAVGKGIWVKTGFYKPRQRRGICLLMCRRGS